MNDIKPFARQGNFTTVDNAVFDVIMPLLSGSEFKILCVIIRKTIGYQKEIDGISYSQLTIGAGIKSNTTVQKALSGLILKGLIERGKTGILTDPHYYRLNKDYTCRVTENVKQPVTFSVKQPVTENVNTKEKEKKEKNNFLENQETIIVENGNYRTFKTVPSNSNYDPEIVKLITLFTQQTALFPPHDTTDEYKEKWYLPMERLHTAFPLAIEKRIVAAIKELRDIRFRVYYPSSIYKTAVGLQPKTNGENKQENDFEYLPGRSY